MNFSSKKISIAMCSLNDHDVMYNGRLDIIMRVSFNISLFGNFNIVWEKLNFVLLTLFIISDNDVTLESNNK